jgi:23S rRNA pseudouridine1911/1915/1917 synthase
MNFEILLETPHFLVVNKPHGIIVEQNPWEDSVEIQVQNYLSKKSKKSYLGIIHRLDRVTSGALILAKKKSALKDLNEQFRLKKVQKTYLAIVEKEPPNEKDILKNWLKKDQKNKKAILFSEPNKNATKCILSYEKITSNSTGHLLKIKPKTGKFHQIRAQLANIDCPIIGDEKYGAKTPFQKNYICLHAHELTFKNPHTNKLTHIKAPLPKNKYWNSFNL